MRLPLPLLSAHPLSRTNFMKQNPSLASPLPSLLPSPLTSPYFSPTSTPYLHPYLPQHLLLLLPYLPLPSPLISPPPSLPNPPLPSPLPYARPPRLSALTLWNRFPRDEEEKLWTESVNAMALTRFVNEQGWSSNWGVGVVMGVSGVEWGDGEGGWWGG